MLWYLIELDFVSYASTQRNKYYIRKHHPEEHYPFYFVKQETGGDSRVSKPIDRKIEIAHARREWQKHVYVDECAEEWTSSLSSIPIVKFLTVYYCVD